MTEMCIRCGQNVFVQTKIQCPCCGLEFDVLSLPKANIPILTEEVFESLREAGNEVGNDDLTLFSETESEC